MSASLDEISALDPKEPVLTLRPKSSAFWAAYLNYDKYDGPKVWRTVGGGIGVLYGPHSNSCATRVSYGLNYGGAPVRPFAGASRNLPGHSYAGKAGDGMRYIVSARQMNIYLKLRWGNADENPQLSTDLAVFETSLKPGQCAIFATRGHTGVLTPGYQDPYVAGFLPVDVWLLPP